MTLDLAMVTHTPEGLLRILDIKLPEVEGVKYVVSWQSHGDAPVPDEIAARKDIQVHRFDGTGVSNNRNNAISFCTGDIILFADNDVTYSAEGLRAVITAFEQNPDVDLATFRSARESACVYPATETKLGLKLPKNYYVCSIEIAFRRSTAGFLRCHPDLSFGSRWFQGADDEIFLWNAIKVGLNCRFFPVTICRHDHPSLGTKAKLNDSNLRAAGCVIAFYYPRTAFLRIPLKAWRVCKAGQASFIRALLMVSHGAFLSLGIRSSGRKMKMW